MTPVEDIPPLSPGEAERLARDEHVRFRELLAGLSAADWERPTDCPGWTVRLLVAHVTGATEANAAPPEMARQILRGRAGLRVSPDLVSAAQVADRAELSPDRLVERLRRAESRAVTLRMLQARLAGFVPLPVGEPLNETWPLRYLLRVIYTRDVWMHRVDVARACGRPLRLDGGHDGRIVADLVREWARRHRRPFSLKLTGPAGGVFATARPGVELELDAIEFARRLSGRGEGAQNLFATPVPF